MRNAPTDTNHDFSLQTHTDLSAVRRLPHLDPTLLNHGILPYLETPEDLSRHIPDRRLEIRLLVALIIVFGSAATVTELVRQAGEAKRALIPMRAPNINE